jgi:hypothetical protein
VLAESGWLKVQGGRISLWEGNWVGQKPIPEAQHL